jgi:3-oxoacyl-[acyl-carrier protein] reductase
LNDKQKTDISAMIPSQRFGTPMDIAAGCLYLASNEGGYITGQTLHINGGMAMV